MKRLERAEAWSYTKSYENNKVGLKLFVRMTP